MFLLSFHSSRHLAHISVSPEAVLILPPVFPFIYPLATNLLVLVPIIDNELSNCGICSKCSSSPHFLFNYCSVYIYIVFFLYFSYVSECFSTYHSNSDRDFNNSIFFSFSDCVLSLWCSCCCYLFIIYLLLCQINVYSIAHVNIIQIQYGLYFFTFLYFLSFFIYLFISTKKKSTYSA